MFALTQTEFSQALMDPERAVPAGVVAPTAASSERFAIYRNNVITGLVGALRSRFPATEKIVGADYFAALARVFVAGHPPRSPVLLDYGDDFAAFMDRFEPVRGLPYLSDVARIESARVRAYHAADDQPCTVAQLAAVAPEILPDTKLLLRPSVHVVCSHHPVVTIWEMNAGRRAVQEIEAWTGETALIARPETDVTVRALAPGMAALVAALLAGVPLGAAMDRAASADADFAPAPAIAALFAGKLVGRIQLSESRK